MVADLAFRNPDISDAGVNALAWLANFISSKESAISEADLEVLQARLPAYAMNRTLAHNANACRRAIAERRGGSQQ
jgi:hypothetical protein